MKNLEGLSRDQLINRLNKISCKPQNLGLTSTKYVQYLVLMHSIDISNKFRNSIIAEIYNKIKNIKVPSDSVINVEVKKCKKKYFKEYTLSASKNEGKDISAYLEFHRELKDIIEDMHKSNTSIKGQLSLECIHQRELVNGETQGTTWFFSLRATDIFNLDDFLTSQFQKLVLKESLNSTDA